MSGLINFWFSFIFSFVGSIPPGTLNLSVIQLGLSERINAALRFCLAAALIEYPYAWIAVSFEKLITRSPFITDNIHLTGAIIMTLLGTINLLPASKSPSKIYQSISKSGFRKGVVLSILNPLAIPYWIGITAYLRSQQWIDVSTPTLLHSYLIGVSLGALILLILLAYLSKRIATTFISNPWLKKIPGLVLISLGIYAFVEYLL